VHSGIAWAIVTTLHYDIFVTTAEDAFNGSLTVLKNLVGNRKLAPRVLGLDRKTPYRKLKGMSLEN